MPRTFLAVLASVALASGVTAADKPTLVEVPGELPVAGATIVVVDAGSAGPGIKGHKAVATSAIDKPVELPGGGPFDVYLVPKGGLAVRAAEKWTAKAGKNELRLEDELGTVRVRGDDLPRASKIVLAEKDDPGPDSDDHVATQAVAAYTDVLIVPGGYYAVWVVPANGGRATKVADKVKVTSGRQTRVPEE